MIIYIKSNVFFEGTIYLEFMVPISVAEKKKC